MIESSVPRKMPFTVKEWEESKNYVKKNVWIKIDKDYYNNLKYKKIDINTFQSKPNFIGIDTETYQTNGNLICLCNSKDDSVLIRKNNSESDITIHDYFHYFMRLKKQNDIFLAWNLKFDASIILKSLNENQLSFLDEEGEVSVDKIKIRYIPKKYLSISMNKQNIKIFDAMQFYIMSLDDASKKYLGEHKKYDGIYQNKQFPDSIDDNELNLIIEYCQKDCVLTERLMNEWVEKFYDSFGFYPKDYYSVGSIAVTYLKTKLDSMPVFECAQYTVQETAFNAYYGGRFEIFSRGKHENIYHYDINSAYPYAMSKMPDFANGKWIEIKNMEEYIKYRKNIGFYTIQCKVNEEKLCPFLFRSADGLISCPSGEFRTNTTSMEIDVALEFYDVEITFVHGWAFQPENNIQTEFSKLVEDMYEIRKKQNDELQKTVYKFMINSLYGKFAQSKPEPRGLFSPICCSYITGFCRAQILKACAKNKNDIVMIATDGIFSKKPLNVDTKGNKILGNWEEEHHPLFYLVMAGIYSYNTQENKELVAKSRGFGLTTFNEKTGKKDNFSFLEAELKINDKKELYFEIQNLRPVSIKHALIQKDLDVSQIGKMNVMTKEINLNGDKKRIWLGAMSRMDDYNTSISKSFVRIED